MIMHNETQINYTNDNQDHDMMLDIINNGNVITPENQRKLRSKIEGQRGKILVEDSEDSQTSEEEEDESESSEEEQ